MYYKQRLIFNLYFEIQGELKDRPLTSIYNVYKDSNIAG